MGRTVIRNVRAAEDFVRRNVEGIRSCQCPLCAKVLRLIDDHLDEVKRRTFISNVGLVADHHGWR